jgi:hypothetical protein
MTLRYGFLLVAVGALACTAKETKTTMDSGAAMKSAAAATPNTVTFTATDFSFQGPDSFPAGLTTIRLVNQGQTLHHAQLLKFDQGKTLSDFIAAMKAMKPGEMPPMWAAPAGGPNPPAIGAESSVTEDLQPGSYAVVCFVDIPDKVPHIMKGMSHAFTVTAATGAAPAEPTADVNVKLADYKFDFAPALTAGHHMIRVDNTGPQPHEIFIAKLDSGKTMNDLMKWAETYKGKPPITPLGGIATMLPGAHGFFPVDLTPGDYAVLCFVPDAKDGKPHMMHGMAQTIKVS